MPKTRDRFIHNPLANLLNPKIADKNETKQIYKHDKLDVSDIHGAKGDVYGRQRSIEGRNIMDTSDIDKTKPKILKQNRITNIPDYKIDSSDINKEAKKKFNPSRVTDPLNPVYRMETVSRRHIMEIG